MNRLLRQGIYALAFLSGTLVAAQSYGLDKKASKLNWTGFSEYGNYSQSGTLDLSHGRLIMARDSLKQLQITVNMKSLQHEDAKLERHLKDQDFFYVKKFPVATLELIRSDLPRTQYNLTIRGVTQTYELPLQVSKERGRLVLEGKLKIDRTQFNIKYNSSSYFQDLGSYAIKNEFELAYYLVFTLVE